LLALALFAPLARAVDITGVEAGNVTPFSFTLIWTVSASSTPGLEVFADNGEVVDLGDSVSIEFYPFHLGDRSVSSDYSGRLARSALEAEVISRNLVMARISGLNPGTAYFVRPKALDGGGLDITTNGPLPLTAVTTALENAFVEDSRQLVLDFSSSAPALSHGAIARVSSTGLPYPLFAVVGDGAIATEAFFNLDNLLDAAGLANLNPSSPLDLQISVRGVGALEGVMEYTVPFSGGFVVAQSLFVPYNPVSGAVASFSFDPIPDQLVNTPFTVTIRALDSSGEVLTGFAGTVDLGGNLTMSAGDGQTPAFTGGVLADHSVTFNQTGNAQLTATETGGSATGTSNSFSVAELLWTLSISSVPSSGGTTTGAGTYADGTEVEILALPAENYLFNGWIGDGIADIEAASTTILMTGNRSVTAVFEEDLIIESYDEFKQEFFLRLANDPLATDPANDFDFDGLTNLLEYYFGTDPLHPDGGGHAPVMQLSETGAPVFNYVRRISATDVTFIIETGSQLDGGWTPHTPDPGDITVVDLGDGLEEVSIEMPVPTVGTPEFVRLNISLVTP
jgi:hypothetical protein